MRAFHKPASSSPLNFIVPPDACEYSQSASAAKTHRWETASAVRQAAASCQSL